ncbi:MAG: hypothetical protein ACJAT8_000081 [Cellvibrionaceae bacterium]|jgi:hypothetical protein
MAFGDQIYRQTNITTSKCHECETRFIKMPLTCPPAPVNVKTHKTPAAAIESSMNGGSLSITGLGRSSL